MEVACHEQSHKPDFSLLRSQPYVSVCFDTHCDCGAWSERHPPATGTRQIKGLICTKCPSVLMSRIMQESGIPYRQLMPMCWQADITLLQVQQALLS